MAQTYGPKYPGIKDGLVFSFDPKNRDCWSGGGMTGTVYDSVNNLNGTLSFANADDEFAGALTTEGYFNYDGTDDDIDFTYDSNLELQEFTVEAWVNWDGTVGNKGFIEVMAGSTAGWFMGQYSGNNFKFYSQTPGWQSIGSTTPSSDTWYHVVGVLGAYGTSNNKKLYINTALDSQQTTSANVSYSTSNVRIGYYDSNWSGKIGPINIYNRALSSSEVLTNYNRLKGRFGL